MTNMSKTMLERFRQQVKRQKGDTMCPMPGGGWVAANAILSVDVVPGKDSSFALAVRARPDRSAGWLEGDDRELLEIYRDEVIVMIQDAQAGIATIPSYVTVEVAE